MPETEARVTMGKKELLGDSVWPHAFFFPTHVHMKDGFYGIFTGKPEDEPGPGEWLLVVSKEGMSPVVQQLTLALKGAVLQVKPGWGTKAGRLEEQCATVTIVNAGQSPSIPIGGAQNTPQHSTINVLLQRRFEVVNVAAHNHLDSADYVKACTGRRNLLYKAGLLNEATIFTRFECDTRARVVSVKSSKPDHRSFVEVGREVKHPLSADQGKERPYETIPHELGVVDFYQHLNDRGKNHSNTVVEAGVFSHGWVQGPLFWDTADVTTSTTERSDKDLDARQKDWLPPGKVSQTPTGPVNVGPTMDEFPDIIKAFAFESPLPPPEDGVFASFEPALRLWGCVHMLNVVNSIRDAYHSMKQGVSRNQFFRVKLESGGRENATLDHVKRHIAEYGLSNKFGRMLEMGDFRGRVNYPGAAAQFLENLPVFGAPPGLGASYRQLDGEFIFKVDDEAIIHGLDPQGNPISGPNENFIPYQWFRAEYGEHFVEDALHYLDYTSFLKVSGSLPDPGWSTQRWAKFKDGGQGACVLRLPSGFEVFYLPGAAGGPIPHPNVYGEPLVHQVNGVNGHLYPIHNAHASQVALNGPSIILAIQAATSGQTKHVVFVGEDGQTLLMEDKGGNQFAVSQDALPKFRWTFKGRSSWGEPTTQEGTVQNGVLEKVTPRWFW